MTPTKDITEARRRLIAAGIRTLGFNFDGCGDDGSLQEICFPDNPALALAKCEEPNEFTPAYSFSFNDSEQTTKVKAFKTKLELLVDVSVLQDLAYAALVYFPGDWVNNDGGYGVVALDLLSGEFKIDGYERYTEVNAVDAGGTVTLPLDVLDTTFPLDVTTVLRSTLGIT